jgi:sn1-specific diacylglycerol lipase
VSFPTRFCLIFSLYLVTQKFGVARGITSTFASGAGTIADYALTGRNNGTGLALGLAVSSAFGFAESVAIGSIMLGERIAVASIAAAQDSVDLLLGLFGNDEASFSLTAFGQLVRREWSSPVMAEHLPEKRYGLPAMMQALAAWAAIQSITQFYTETQWFEGIREVRPAELETMMPTNVLPSTGVPHEVHVTDDTLLPNHGGQIVSAEIGHMGQTNHRKPQSRVLVLPTLRRLSKMVLAGYGGAGMIFFGVPLIHKPDDATGSFSSPEAVRSGEESVVKEVIGSIDIEDNGEQVKDKATQSFSWWNLLLGKVENAL